MSGIFYDPRTRKLRRVDGKPPAEWQLVTHNVDAGLHQCRRIMREWLRAEEISGIDFTPGEALSA
jgi:hypothetical protein